MPDIPPYQPLGYKNVEPPKVSYDPSFNPFDRNSYSSSHKSTNRWDELYKGLEKQEDFSPEWTDGGNSQIEDIDSLYKGTEEQAKEELSVQNFQYKGKYIMTSVRSGLMIIDQHRAHIRILYDRYMSQIKQQKGVSQGLLFPEMVQIPVADVPIMQSILDDMLSLGFDLTDLGGGSYSISGIPTGIEGLDVPTLIQDMLRTATEKSGKVKEEVQHTLALTMAKSAAIVVGQVLSNEEMQNLVEQLLTTSTPNYTPDGNPVLYVLKDDDIGKFFK